MEIAGFEPWARKQALELALAMILYWLKPQMDRFEFKFDQEKRPLCPLPNRSIFQSQESCDLQGCPLDQNSTVA